MIDEIKLEERLQWDLSSNKILGLCQKHNRHIGVDFCSVTDVTALMQGSMC